MARRRRGLKHMILTKDVLLAKCHPTDIVTWDDYLQDCEKAVNIPECNSDEYSTNDEDLANEERNNKKRPERIHDTNSVIKIRTKPWRSRRVCNLLF
jgi:hypothetical protein